ncbi:MAG: hypothetical protein H8E84_02330, partial [Flavobacteriales bacterium]|nr:hypothetical protein [Flavobacteriales bacterium]
MKTLSKILMIALCSSFMSYAQVTNQLNPNFINQVPSVKECGTEATPQQILHMTQTREDRQDWEQPETFITIPVQHHIVRMNDGSGGLDPLEITGLMQDLNDYYVNSNMQFYECSGVNFINSTTNYNFNTTNTNSFCGANDVADVLNIYYFNSITSSSGSSLCGVSYFPPSSDRSLMKNSCALNGTTIVHEVGHYFSLYHSHGKTNCGTTDELVNGSNCATAGDDVCDTPADPNLQLSSTGSGCGSTTWVNNTTSCSYTGTFTDANGDSYSPDPTNIMSYSLKSCRTNLTAGQYNRANFSAVNDRNNLTCSSSNPDLSIGNGSFWNGFIWGGSPGTPPITINNNWIIYNQIQVVNDASGSGTIPSELGFYLSTNSTISTGDYFLGWNPVPSISPGDTSIQSAVFDIGSSYYNSIPNGTYYIGAYADYSNVVYETTASNNGEAFQYSNGIINPLTGTFIWNYYQITITRGCMDSLASNYNANANIDDGSCTYPDLEITNESHLVTICFPQPCTTSTPPVSINGSIIDFNVEVTNNGTGSASPTQLGYYLSLNANIVPNLVDHLLGTDQVDGGFTLIGVPLQILYFDLAVGNTSTETATFDLADTAFNNIPDGTYYIGAYADYDNTLYESNEYNNDAAFEYAFNPVMGYTNYQITILRGCTDSTAINYNAAATIDDGTCIPCIYGCTGPSFCNYDSTATCDDGSCFGMMGCTDAFASNYDAMATCDDGSCIPCTDNQVTIIINTGNWGYEMDWNLTNSSGVVVASNCCVLNYFSTTDSMEVVELCLPDDCYSMNMFDYYGDGWNGGTYEIWTTGPINSATMIASGTALNMNNVAGPAGSDNVQIGTTVSCAVLGCTDPTATNYDPNATVDDGSCIFSSIVIS